MNFRSIYKTLNWTGILLFIAGVIGDANAIPYLRNGATIGPILFIIGTLIWIPLRIKKPILHPYNSEEYNSVADTLFAFVLNNFVLEFWAFCCAFGMLLVLGGGASMKNTSGFEKAIEIVSIDREIANKIGVYKGTGALVAGTVSSTIADLDFSAYGTKGGTRINIKLSKETGEWILESLKFD